MYLYVGVSTTSVAECLNLNWFKFNEVYVLDIRMLLDSKVSELRDSFYFIYSRRKPTN